MALGRRLLSPGSSATSYERRETYQKGWMKLHNSYRIYLHKDIHTTWKSLKSSCVYSSDTAFAQHLLLLEVRRRARYKRAFRIILLIAVLHNAKHTFCHYSIPIFPLCITSQHSCNTRRRRHMSRIMEKFVSNHCLVQHCSLDFSNSLTKVLLCQFYGSSTVYAF